jgi:hypothetical protein
MQKSYQQMRESLESALLRLIPKCRQGGARQLGMDDADMRRGNPALHCVYGEGMALLAAVTLLNGAYAIFGQTPELIREATECIGVDGMIGGQAIDLCSHSFDTADLAERNRKTSAMMRLALTAGALRGGASRDDVAALAGAGLMLGEAYQRGDDILDACGTAELSGKTAGQDSRHQRLSHAGFDSETWLEQTTGLIEGARHSLEGAYGRTRTAPLMSFVDGMFASLAAKAHGSN